MRYQFIFLCATLITCKQRNESSTKEILGIDSTFQSFTFYNDGEDRIAVTNIRTNYSEFRFLLISQVNPVGVLEGVYGFRKMNYYGKNYEDAVNSCQMYKAGGLKWRLPTEEDAKFLLKTGFSKISDPQFKSRGQFSEDSSFGPIFYWIYSGDPSVDNRYTDDPSLHSPFKIGFMSDADVEEGEDQLVTQIYNATEWYRQNIRFKNPKKALVRRDGNSTYNYFCVSYNTYSEDKFPNAIEDSFKWVPPEHKKFREARAFLHRNLKNKEPRIFQYLMMLEELNAVELAQDIRFSNKERARKIKLEFPNDPMQISDKEQKHDEQEYESAVEKTRALQRKYDPIMKSYTIDELKRVYEALSHYLELNGESMDIMRQNFRSENLRPDMVSSKATRRFLEQIEPHLLTK